MLEKEVETMNFINEEFAKESEDYRKMNERLTKKIGPQDTNSKGSNSGEGSKRQRIQPSRKAKRKSVSGDEPELQEARAEMRVLMKTVPAKFQLKRNETFTSFTNKKILSNLVPELLRLMVPYFYPIWKQLHEWLSALHKYQRGRYQKMEMGKLEEDNHYLYSNSWVNEVRLFMLLYLLFY